MDCSRAWLCSQGLDIKFKRHPNEKDFTKIYGYTGPGGGHLPAGHGASADYVQNWSENGLYGTPATHQTWDKAEAFLLSGGTWTGPGLTINSGTGWTATLINPTYALATGDRLQLKYAGEF